MQGFGFASPIQFMQAPKAADAELLQTPTPTRAPGAPPGKPLFDLKAAIQNALHPAQPGASLPSNLGGSAPGLSDLPAATDAGVSGAMAGGIPSAAAAASDQASLAGDGPMNFGGGAASPAPSDTDSGSGIDDLISSLYG